MPESGRSPGITEEFHGRPFDANAASEFRRVKIPRMKITSLEVHILRLKGDDPRPHWVSNFIVPRANEILVRMRTDEGLEGIGIATSYTPIEAAIKAFNTGIGELVI